jgi:hypothetical protein
MMRLVVLSLLNGVGIGHKLLFLEEEFVVSLGAAEGR